MALGTSIVDVVLIIAIMFAAGEVTGLTGFGFALVSTTTLAIVLDPETAVVIAILPVPATNIELVTELDRERLGRCMSRF
jgi:uncharacterized membrane protein YfcA